MRHQKKLVMTALAWTASSFMFFPIFWMGLTAFKTDLDALQSPPKLFFSPTLENFHAANHQMALVRPLMNSAIEAFGATLLCLLLALPAAYGMAFHDKGDSRRILLGMLMTRFMPAIGTMMPIYLIFRTIGLIDTQFGLIIIYTLINLPIVIWMAYSYFREIPNEIIDAARLDGATPKQQIVFVLFPVCFPGICSTALLSSILCWNEGFWSLQMTSSNGAPLSAFIATLSGAGDLVWTKLAAASLLAIAPVTLVGWLTMRQLVRGLTFGAVR